MHPRRIGPLVWCAFAAIGLLAAPAHAEPVALIPRTALFSRIERENPQVSPDGKRLAYLAPDDQQVLHLWVRTLGQNDDRQLTRDGAEGVGGYEWAWDDRHILYFQDRNGDENLHLWSTDLETGAVRDLTPFAGIRAQNLRTAPSRPDEVLVGMNLLDRSRFDMYRVHLETGACVLDTQNPGDALSWTTDENLVIRAACAMDPETADTIVRIRDRADAPWRTLLVSPFESTHFLGQVNGGTLVVGFAPGGRSLYMVSMLNSDLAQLVEIDAATGKELRVIASHPRCDVAAAGFNAYEVLQHPKTGAPQAVGFEEFQLEWKVLDKDLSPVFEALARIGTGHFFVSNRDREARKWVVRFYAADAPSTYYLYDRDTRRAEKLFDSQPELMQYDLAPTTGRWIPARDGMKIPIYVTLPEGIPAKRLPAVLLVHGGPWFRDSWRYDPQVQWLANRGYAVVQVNFRGSIGFGKRHLNASTGQWGVGAMQHDLSDTVKWLIQEGIADPKRIGIMGGSYGGYATLAGLAFTPELYACGVDEVGPSRVRTLLQSIPAYWKPVKRRWLRRIGDAETDDALDQRISPLFHVDRMRAPLFVAHGANDPRVKQVESDQIVAARRARGGDVTYLVYPDEGHGIGRPANALDLCGRVEEFLAQHLGGRAEPWVKIEGATGEVK
jgi:dipeptidyl aminopeptidase/acylaminoacyl peptidase